MLRVGSRGDDVRALHEKLAAVGFACAVDGAFGPQTAAVVTFQKAHGLTADGVVGPMTWAALDRTGGTTPKSEPPTTEPPTTKPADKGAQPGIGGNDTPPPITSSGPRDAIVAAARAKIGSVFSNTSGAPDETGQATRQGWETLLEIFTVEYPSFNKNIVKYIKYGFNNGGAGSSHNGLVSWCGVFATYAVIIGGGTAGTWESGDRVSNMKRITSSPKPGDVGYFHAKQHHCIIASVNGDQIETIDGNSYDEDAGGNGAITSRMRNRADFAGFFRQVDD